jgi:hypothetical protein
MHMLMVVFRSSLKERVHELLHRCDVKALTRRSATARRPQLRLSVLPRN